MLSCAPSWQQVNFDFYICQSKWCPCLVILVLWIKHRVGIIYLLIFNLISQMLGLHIIILICSIYRGMILGSFHFFFLTFPPVSHWFSETLVYASLMFDLFSKNRPSPSLWNVRLILFSFFFFPPPFLSPARFRPWLNLPPKTSMHLHALVLSCGLPATHCAVESD